MVRLPEKAENLKTAKKIKKSNVIGVLSIGNGIYAFVVRNGTHLRDPGIPKSWQLDATGALHPRKEDEPQEQRYSMG